MELLLALADMANAHVHNETAQVTVGDKMLATLAGTTQRRWGSCCVALPGNGGCDDASRCSELARACEVLVGILTRPG